MPGITQFNIWESETQEYIANLTEATQGEIDKESLAAWLYTEGVVILHTRKAAALQNIIKQEQRSFQPPIRLSFNNVLETIILAFLDLKIELHKKFDITVNVYHYKLHQVFNNYLNKVLRHEAYFHLQAEVYSTINIESVTNPNFSQQKANEIQSSIYSAAMQASTSAALIADIRNAEVYQTQYNNHLATRPTPPPVPRIQPTLMFVSRLGQGAKEAKDDKGMTDVVNPKSEVAPVFQRPSTRNGRRHRPG
jgi:hypothetical protein